MNKKTFKDIEVANALDVDYIGISPVFGTPTKTDTAEPFGLEGLRKAVNFLKDIVIEEEKPTTMSWA